MNIAEKFMPLAGTIRVGPGDWRVSGVMALNFEVPESYQTTGRAPNLGDISSSKQPQLTVHSGCKAPCDSLVAVCYKGHHFWIDDSDFNSKRSMNYLKILLALADTEQRAPTPALTIRAN